MIAYKKWIWIIFFFFSINLESYSEFQIANFVADHPSILKLANVLRDSKETPAGNSVNESLNIQNEKVILIVYY